MRGSLRLSSRPAPLVGTDSGADARGDKGREHNVGPLWIVLAPTKWNVDNDVTRVG